MKYLECIRCSGKMKFLKEYKLDNTEKNKGIYKMLFSGEDQLTFKIFVCTHCRHTEFFYTGYINRID